MKQTKLEYEAPTIRVIKVVVEQGFNISGSPVESLEFGGNWDKK